MRSSLLLRPLPLPWLLALRYLRSTRKDALVTFLSAVATLGIALGVAALILVMAALSGLHESMLGQILASTPEIEVALPADLDPAEALAAARGVEGVTSAQLLVRGQGWLVLEDVPQAVKLVGYEGPLPASFPEASARRPGLYLPADLVQRWQLEEGQRLAVLSPRPTLTPLGPQPRVRTAALAGTFETFATDPVLKVALPLDVAEALLGTDNRFLEVATGDLDRALEVAPRLEAALPAGCRVRSWKDLNRSLYFVLRLEKSLLFVAVWLIVLVAALALVVDLALVISSKRREIGMLGAMGASAGVLRRTFLLLGGLLAALGMFTGTLLGLGGAFLLEHFRVLRVPGQVLFVDYIPFKPTASDVGLILAVTLVLVLAASQYAAHRAAAIRPVEALGHGGR